MHLYRVNIVDFRRLVDTSFYVTGKLTALIGPNESGKSSALQALAAFTSRRPTDESNHYRRLTSIPDAKEAMLLSCDFRLSPDDRELLSDLPITPIPESVNIELRYSGTSFWGFEPRPIWRPNLAEDLIELLTEVRDVILLANIEHDERDQEEAATLDQHSKTMETAMTAVREGSGLKDVDWDLVRHLIAEYRPTATDAPVDTRPLDEFVQYRVPHRGATQLAINALTTRVPRFLAFDGSDRDLRSEYDIDEVLANPQNYRGVLNLCRVAQLELRELQAAIEFGQRSRRMSMINQCNERLREFFLAAWRQRNLSVRLNLEGRSLEIAVEEHDDQHEVIDIAERSDGLRIYIALICFLHAQQVDTNVVLLVDEADLHLHYDAQADLINILSDSTYVAKVIYSTHSPGCLPRDLGTGVRMVVPRVDDSGTSEIRHDFWALGREAGVGFNSLLFALGASAAAFAYVRYAVIAEGPSEMILLPSLLRLALSADELPYQVAPGIAVHPSAEMADLGDAAVTTCFLVDGDSQGAEWAAQLQRVGINTERVIALDSSQTLEDLIPPELYVSAVRELTGATVEDLSVDSIAHPFRAAMRSRLSGLGLDLPGAIAISEHIVGQLDAAVHEPLFEGAEGEILRALDRRIRQALGL